MLQHRMPLYHVVRLSRCCQPLVRPRCNLGLAFNPISLLSAQLTWISRKFGHTHTTFLPWSLITSKSAGIINNYECVHVRSQECTLIRIYISFVVVFLWNLNLNFLSVMSKTHTKSHFDVLACWLFWFIL